LDRFSTGSHPFFDQLFLSFLQTKPPGLRAPGGFVLLHNVHSAKLRKLRSAPGQKKKAGFSTPRIAHKAGNSLRSK
jgi:hypothetical protein